MSSSPRCDMALLDALQRVWWQRRTRPLAWLLGPLGALYGLVHWGLQAPWKWGLRTSWKAPVPVVVVGNVVVGGAGKTPTVMALAQAFSRRGWRPAIVSRGYGGRRVRPEVPTRVAVDAQAMEVGDEPLLMARRTGIPVWVGKRRVAAVQALCSCHPEVDLIISDDGLQHRALHRDAQLIVFDERGAGNERLLPAGPLREPMPESTPPRTKVLYNASVRSTSLAGDCAVRRLTGLLPLKTWWAQLGTCHSGDAKVVATVTEAVAEPLEHWRGKEVLAIAGIGHPERFFSMLELAGLQVKRLPLPDHAVMHPRPWPASASLIVMTEKDAVKLPPDDTDADRIYVATLDFRIPDSTVDALEHLLRTSRHS